ncbi:MAG TPA: chemotaxis protein CheD [Pseudogracilibacillus sp.]|nr:chemotaxis protein CheD [Pseudogracilibacillus sp.]
MNNTLSVVKVGIADLNVVEAPNKIRTSGLGSCVGVVIYDNFKKVAGLAHVMLPDSKLTKQAVFNKYKYADTAIDSLIKQLIALGARKSQLKAKVAGGAQMFQFQTGSDIMRIGPRNTEAVKEHLKKHHIPIISSDTGGNQGRTIEFDPLTSKLKIRTVNQGETYI